MTDKEAMKLALEFIERVNKDGWILADFEPQMYEAIAALEERLAQPKQKPRAWLVEFENGEEELHFDEQSVGETQTPLYTHPPQRTWVGLTDDEAQQTFAKHNCTNSTHLAGILARAIEAKLKEKNT